ncbi:MAG: MFS transporter [Candidatus Aenigmarchaeota archaeon]|nr:MFS transporter [Candidatus Aenigmarchaeota archaeon]
MGKPDIDRITEEERSSSMNYSLMDSLFSSAGLTLTTTMFSAFAVAIGADNIFIGLLASIPLIFWTVMQIPAYKLVDFRFPRKLITISALGISRLMVVPIIFIPFMPADSRLMTFLVLVTLSSLFGAIAGPSWSSWMGDLVPSRIRGKYFSKRLRLASLFSIMGLILATGVLAFSADSSLTGFQIIFSVGLAAGMIALFFIARMKDPGFSRSPDFDDYSGTAKRFRKFILMFFIWHFGVTLSAPFYVVRLLSDLNAAYFWVPVQVITASAAMVFFQTAWGKYADKFGSRVIMLIGAVSASFYPFVWLFVQNPYQMLPTEILSGFAWGGFNLAYFNYLLEISPEGKRHRYSAFFYLTFGVAGVLGPITGGLISAYFAESYLLWFTGLEVTFFISWIFRLAAAILFIKFLEELNFRPVVSMSYVFGEMVRYGHKRAVSRVYMTSKKGIRAAVLTGKGFRVVGRELNGMMKDVRIGAKLMNKMEIEQGVKIVSNMDKAQKILTKTLKSIPSKLEIIERGKGSDEAKLLRLDMDAAKKSLDGVGEAMSGIVSKPEDATDNILEKMIRDTDKTLDLTRKVREHADSVKKEM